MCGICGFAGFTDEELLRRMTEAIVHRGPDGDGYYTDDSGVSLGMRRLAVIDLDTGAQPIYNEDRSVIVVFNGEIYNFAELRSVLQAKGHVFRTRTDTEVIVHLYEEHGEDCPKLLRGMFAFALWDEKRKKLFISRDHFGIKPLYYAEDGGRFYFGSEMKCLLQSGGVSGDIDYSALDYYLTFLYVPSPVSIFRKIKKLPPAHALVWEGGRLRISRYWNIPGPGSGGSQSEGYYVENIRSLLKNSIAEQKMSDVPLGVFLSGGLDSSTIVAFLSAISGVPVRTFTIGYGKSDRTYDETSKARAVAERFGCEHFEHVLRPDVMETVSRLVTCFDEPFADSSAIPTYAVSREARKKITVALTGIGGDELFAGYPRHIGARLSMFYENLPSFSRRAISSLIERVSEDSSSRNVIGRIKRFARGGMTDFRGRYIAWVSFLSTQEKKELYAGDLYSHMEGDSWPFAAPAGKLDSPDDLCAWEISNYLTDDLLCLADRTSMANSLELRVPFLDVRLVEFMCGIPLSMKTRGFKLKHLLKSAMKERLPADVLRQSKMGFQTPVARWINEDMRPMVMDILSPDRIRRGGLINPEYVSRLIEEHGSGKRNRSDVIYALLVFELWKESILAGMPNAGGAGIKVQGRRLTVLIGTDCIPQDEEGGSARVPWELAKGLARDGHRVIIVTKGVRGKMPAETVDGIEIYRYGFNPLRLRRILKGVFSRHHVDIINLHHPYTGLWAGIFSGGLPAVYTFHSPWHEEYEIRSLAAGDSPVKRFFLSALRKCFERIVLLRSGRVAVSSRFMAERLSKFHGMSSLVVPLGVDLAKFSTEGNRVAERERLGIPVNSFVVFTVRNLSPRMGLENLAAAAAEVVKKRPEAYFIIGGKGPLEKILAGLVAEHGLENHVRLTGFIPEEDLAAYYRCSDLFILPTRLLEGFGLVTLEALACGTPVLATPVGANAEVLGPLGEKFLLKDAGSEAIAAGILRFMKESGESAQELRVRCRKFAEEGFGWEHFTGKMEEVFLGTVPVSGRLRQK